MNDNIDNFPSLKRPAFFDGQRLSADGLGAVQQFNQSLHHLHNRSFHDWGIVFGLEVFGQRGEHVVQLNPGYGLDERGHDLILSDRREITIPSVASAADGGPAEYYLTASYAKDADLSAEIRTGTCGTAGAVRRLEQPLIRWQDPFDLESASRYRHGLDIILATIKVQNCQLVESVSGTKRRDAVPAQQPYIAGGQTPFGATNWRLWPPDEDVPLGVATTVSTTCAGFRKPPHYLAQIVGDRTFTDTPIGGRERRLVIDGYTQVAEATAAYFEARMILPSGFTFNNGRETELNPSQVLQTDFLEELRTTLHWYVVWMGVEG